jgi:hypothetical protein
VADKPLGTNDPLDESANLRFVEVMFAKSDDEAIGCRDLLAEQDIPARIEDTEHRNCRSGIAVLVPSDRVVEASELLVTRPQDDNNETYDNADLDDAGSDEDDFEDDEDDEDDDDYDDCEDDDS